MAGEPSPVASSSTNPASPISGGAPAWWSEAVGYEVYVRSFADASGDGMGDLDGLTSRLDHLAWLGVTVVWITPFYPSPGHDAGYDVADYVGVDPTFGDLDAFDRLVGRAHELGLRILIDLVPNHTSSAHPWFVASRSSRDDPHRNWYIWRDGREDVRADGADVDKGGAPPNNWLSVFGGPAWTFDEASRQWWLHLFLPEQPDLNWSEPRVAEAFDEILAFWASRGVDGVRIDVAHGLAKHPELPDLPPATRASRRSVGVASSYASLDHIHDRDQDAVLDVYRRWRGGAWTDADRVLVGEVYLEDPERVARYLRVGDGLHAAFWFPLQEASWDAAELRQAIDDGLRAGTVDGRPGVGVAWATESHDQDRTASRYAPGRTTSRAEGDTSTAGRRRSVTLTAVIMGLPGVPFLYQGQELALPDGHVPPERVADPIALRLGEVERGRDPARTPMPWQPGPGMGFCPPDVEPWLPFGGRADPDTVSVQRSDESSWLHAVRRLIRLRRTVTDLGGSGGGAPVEWIDSDDDVLAYRRGGVIVAANCGDASARVALPAGDAELLWSTPMGSAANGGAPRIADGCVELRPDCAAIVALGTNA